MNGQTNDTQQEATGDTLDLAALGRTWVPQDLPDTSPEVADVLSSLPPLAARGLIYIVFLAVIAVSVWASVFKINTVVQGRGMLIPEGDVRPVQTQQAGAVHYLLVRVGDMVDRDQPLLQLDTAPQSGRLQHLRAELTAGREQYQRLSAAHRPPQEMLEQQQRILALENEVDAAEQALQQCTLTAPVAGAITTLSVRGAGAVVQVGQQIATIAPRDVPLIAMVRLPNGNIARVTPGLPALLKFDAYPWLQYGAASAVVTSVAPDAELDETTGASSYRMLLKPLSATVQTRERSYPLRSGLSLTAEIIIGRKTILRRLYDNLRGSDE